MGRLYRYERVGAAFSESLDSLQSLRNRGFIVNGNPQIVNGIRGKKALKFDGTDDYIDTLNILSIGTGNQSYACWVNPTDLGIGVTRTICNNGNASSSGILIGVRDSKFYVQINGVATFSSTSTILLNIWYYIVVTRSGSTNTLYINNFSEATNSSTPVTPSGKFNIGSTQNGSGVFFGSIKELLVFNRALTAAEVSDLYNDTTFNYENNLVSAWDMSEINPQDVGYKGNGNNGTGNSIAVSDIVDGHNSRFKAINFSGTSDYVTMGNVLNQGTSDFSVVAIIRPGNVSAGNRFFVSKRASAVATNIGFEIYTTTATLTSILCDGSANRITASGSSTLVANKWIHIAVTFDRDGNMTLYLDGVNEGSASISAQQGSINNSIAFNISGENNGSSLFTGPISYVAIYNKVLSNLQIRDIYERQK